MTSDLNQRISALIEGSHIPCISIAIIQDSNILWHKTFEDSSSKLVTSDPVFEAVLGLIGKAKMIFSDQGGIVASLGQCFWQRLKFGNSGVVFRPFVHYFIIKPGMHTVLGRHQPG